MNKVILIGRLTKDPEVKSTSNGTSYCQITLAVDRRYAKNDSQQKADFINCVAWRQTADFIGKYFQKGTKAVISGSLQTRTWADNNNVNHYVTEVLIEDVEFGESKKNTGSSMPYDSIPAPSAPSVQPGPQGNQDRGEYFELDDTGLPF